MLKFLVDQHVIQNPVLGLRKTGLSGKNEFSGFHDAPFRNPGATESSNSLELAMRGAAPNSIDSGTLWLVIYQPSLACKAWTVLDIFLVLWARRFRKLFSHSAHLYRENFKR